MEPWLAILGILSVLIGVALVTAILIYRRQLKRPVGALPKITSVAYTIKQLPNTPPIAQHSTTLVDQPQAWREAMAGIGRIYLGHGIRRIYLLHGTFAGNDPLGLIQLGHMMVPSMSARATTLMHRLLKSSTNFVMKDLGNFSPKYIDLMAQALNLECCDFIWNSANHHVGRLRGLQDLSQELKRRDHELGVNDQLMFIGHSHAGQIFALLALFFAMEDSPQAETARAFREFLAMHFPACHDALKSLKCRNFYFVGLGTPPRYPWPKESEPRLFNIVNHRGLDLDAGNLRSGFFTQKGDYVQRFAIAGSDFIAPTSEERALNAKLNAILDPGDHFPLWRQLTRATARPLNAGTSCLVDLQDHAHRWPNFVTTIFGHGTYTLTRHMLALQTLIAEHFFDAIPPAV